jgi:hypothetical protein
MGRARFLFLFDKREFPFLQPHANALYASWEHPSAAVIFDRQWLVESIRAAGLSVVAAHPPPMRGYQWLLEMRHSGSGVEEIELPPDTAPLGAVTIPPMPANADRNRSLRSAYPARGTHALASLSPCGSAR